MGIIAGILFLVSLAGFAWAGGTSSAPGPEMSAGIVGMTLAAGVVISSSDVSAPKRDLRPLAVCG
jgi:hypothetical protein